MSEFAGGRQERSSRVLVAQLIPANLVIRTRTICNQHLGWVCSAMSDQMGSAMAHRGSI